MPISSPGLGSGLDVSGIVSQLMAVERQPLTRLDQKEARVQSDISIYGALKGSLHELQDALAKLRDADSFRATKADSSDSDIFTVTSDPTAVSSTYSINVTRVAQYHKLGSVEFSSADTFGGAAGDSLTISVGVNSFTLDLSTAMTLSQIQEALNTEDHEVSVVAGLINGNDGNQTLVLTAEETGFDNRVQLTFGGSIGDADFGFSMLNRDADDQLLASENDLDSALNVDGVSVTRSGNEINDVINGLTINLQDTGQANISIEKDASVAKKAMDEFVQAYSGVKEQLNQVKASGQAGSLVRSIEAQLRGVLNRAVPGEVEYAYISELGVTSNSDSGKLEFDSEMFLSSMQDNAEAVLGFFSNDGGFLSKIDSMLDGLLGAGGTIDSMVKGANSRINVIERQRDAMEQRLVAIEKRYLDQFGGLDTLMASMSTTSDYLTRQLDVLSRMIGTNNN